MVTRKEIAKRAAQAAALSVYKTIMNEKVTKTASSKDGKKGLPVKDVAKAAAAATYSSIVKSAQALNLDPQSLSVILSRYPKVKELYDFYQSNGEFTMPTRQFHMGGYSAELGKLMNDVATTNRQDPASPAPEAVSKALNDFIFSHIDMTDDSGAVAAKSVTPQGRLV